MRVGKGISQTTPLDALPLAARAARASAVGRTRRGVETRAADIRGGLASGRRLCRRGCCRTAAGSCAADAGVDLGVASAWAGLCAAGLGHRRVVYVVEPWDRQPDQGGGQQRGRDGV